MEGQQRCLSNLHLDVDIVYHLKPDAHTSLQAAEQHWPDVFKSEQATGRKEQVLADMQVVRPVIETG